MKPESEPSLPFVLLCESDPATLQELQDLLAPLAREVLAVPSARTAIFEFSRRRPDILVTDMSIQGGMDGIELTRNVRAISPDVPVLLLTDMDCGMDSGEHLRKALAIGVNEYLVKPVDPQTLAPAFGRLSRTLYARQELERQRKLNEQMLDANPNPTALVASDTGLVRACNPVARSLGFAVGESCPPGLVPTELLNLLSHMGEHGAKPFRKPPDMEIESQGRSWLLHWAPVGTGRVLLTLSDITSRKAAEKALREESRRLSDVIFGTGAGTWEWNVQTGDLAFNERWAQIIGYTPEELRPANIDTWTRLVHPDDLKSADESLNRHLSGESEQYECECRMRHKNGDWIWILDRGRVTRRAADGSPLLLSGTHMDISERMKITQFREDVERITRHDLKTPLSAFTALPELLLMDDNLTEEQRESLRLIREAGQRMLGMINLSLDLFKMETGTYSLPQEVFPLSSPLAKALSGMRALTRAHDVGIKAPPPEDAEDIFLCGDEDLLVSLLENLIKNALEASPMGGSVELRTSAADGKLTLTLRNAGTVPEDVLPRFFEKYATSGKKHGTGLGTYSALLVATAHGGELALDTSEPGHTTLRLTLPLVGAQ